MHHIIFVGGIHGVGKTQFCKTITEHVHIDHASASDLIRQAGKLLSTTEKQVEKVAENQDLLIYALSQYVSDFQVLLLDGHFCLLDKQLNIQLIPLATFQHIAPKAVVVVTDKPEIIVERLLKRDGKSYALDLIKRFQENEIDYAEHVCKNLNIPLLIHNSTSSIIEVLSFVSKYLPE
ncbi:MAG TPA: ATP-binding protein [Herpetosiphonaceae bacterium]